MADNTPVKQSPIYSQALKMGARFTEGAGWQIPSLFSMKESEIAAARNQVALADVSDMGKIFIEGEMGDTIPLLSEDQPALSVGKGILQNGRYIFRLRSDQLFVSTPADGIEDAIKELSSAVQSRDELVTITNMTHGRSQLLVVGPKAAELLSRLCGLDFHDSQFPNLSARQSSVAKTRQLILRHDAGKVPIYALIGSRSLAAYLWETILEAGRDLHIVPIGQDSVNTLN